MREKLIELLKEADRYEFEEQKKNGDFSVEVGWKLIADHLIANGVTIATENNKWIPVTERLPESKEKVLVYGGRTEIWFNGTKQPMPSIHTGYLRGLVMGGLVGITMTIFAMSPIGCRYLNHRRRTINDRRRLDQKHDRPRTCSVFV